MKNSKIKQMVGIAIMSAIVVILQLMGSFIKFGAVSVSLVLVPIVVGAAMYGPGAGAVLGGVFGFVVLLQPDTAAFYGISFFGTVVTVMAKGILAGWLSGLVFRALSKKNEHVAVFLSALVCPLVNTGLFVVGCFLFFWDAMTQMGAGDALTYLLTVFISFNFAAELLANLICAPVILRILHAAKKH